MSMSNSVSIHTGAKIQFSLYNCRKVNLLVDSTELNFNLHSNLKLQLPWREISDGAINVITEKGYATCSTLPLAHKENCNFIPSWPIFIYVCSRDDVLSTWSVQNRLFIHIADSSRSSKHTSSKCSIHDIYTSIYKYMYSLLYCISLPIRGQKNRPPPARGC